METRKARSEFSTDADYLLYCKKNESVYSKEAEQYKDARMTYCAKLVDELHPAWQEVASDGTLVTVTLPEEEHPVDMDEVFKEFTPLDIGNWIRAHNIALNKTQMLDFLAYINERESRAVVNGKKTEDTADTRQPRELLSKFFDMRVSSRAPPRMSTPKTKKKKA